MPISFNDHSFDVKKVDGQYTVSCQNCDLKFQPNANNFSELMHKVVDSPSANIVCSRHNLT